MAATTSDSSCFELFDDGTKFMSLNQMFLVLV